MGTETRAPALGSDPLLRASDAWARAMSQGSAGVSAFSQITCGIAVVDLVCALCQVVVFLGFLEPGRTDRSLTLVHSSEVDFSTVLRFFGNGFSGIRHRSTVRVDTAMTLDGWSWWSAHQWFRGLDRRHGWASHECRADFYKTLPGNRVRDDIGWRSVTVEGEWFSRSLAVDGLFPVGASNSG
jgi:hypothetical protein